MKLLSKIVLLAIVVLNTVEILGQETNKKWKPDNFYCGFYIYNTPKEKDIKKMSEAGFNLLYTVGSLRKNKKYWWQSEEKEFIATLKLAKKYNLKIVVQSEEAYLVPSHTKKIVRENLLPKAVAFYKKYSKEPEFLAYAIKEEPKPKLLPMISFYYKELKKKIPNCKLFIIHNNTKSASLQPKPYPNIMGHDSYPFYWGWNTYGYMGLTTPSLALYWFRQRCLFFEKVSKKRSVPMVTVFTCQPVWEERLNASNKLFQKKEKYIKEFVKQKRAGWLYNKKLNLYTHPSWYRAPKNCTRAMAWIAVMEGSKMLFHWNWSKDKIMPKEKMFKKSFSLRINNEQFEEYAEACRFFRKHEKIIMPMKKLNKSIVDCKDNSLYHSTNEILKDGKIIVLVNTDVGSWNGGKRKYLKKGDFFKLTADGILKGYVPEKSEKIFTFTIDSKNQDEKLWDIENDKILTKSTKGDYTVSIKPGGGVFLFLGTSNNYKKIKSNKGRGIK